MISGIDETMISRKGRIVKVRPFSGATIEDMYDYLKPMLRKCPNSPPYRLDRHANGGGIMLYVREDVPSKLLPNNQDSEIENIFVEINLRSKK